MARGQLVRAFNPLAREDRLLFEALSSGEHHIRGFTNHDLREKLIESQVLKAAGQTVQQLAGKVSRLLRRVPGQVCRRSSMPRLSTIAVQPRTPSHLLQVLERALASAEGPSPSAEVGGGLTPRWPSGSHRVVSRTAIEVVKVIDGGPSGGYGSATILSIWHLSTMRGVSGVPSGPAW
jgi:hypothetical protein